MVKRGNDDDSTAKPPEPNRASEAAERSPSGVIPFPSSSQKSEPSSTDGSVRTPRRAPGSAPPREPPPAPGPFESDLTQRLRARFRDAILDTTIDRKQVIVLIDSSSALDVARECCDGEDFRMLVDVTAVDWLRREKRFDVVWNLYSFTKNERLRLKTHLGVGQSVASVFGVWPAANWLERECFDLFGIVFDGHPDLRRILLPDEWHGHPLRKDYDILTQDTEWVRDNLGIESGQ
jgi:NADH-quinone oxidoreductase subunit C